MKKSDLETLLAETRQALADVCEKNRELQSRLANSTDNREIEKRRLEEEHKAYELWKATNGSFAQKFIKEYITNNLSVDVETGYSGYFTVKICLEGKVISETCDSITTCRDTLED